MYFINTFWRKKKSIIDTQISINDTSTCIKHTKICMNNTYLSIIHTACSINDTSCINDTDNVSMILEVSMIHV